MKILKIQCLNLPTFENDFAINFFATQKVSDEKNEMVTKLFNNIYTNNVISLIGLNASGKTTTLRLISFVIEMLQNKPINSNSFKPILNEMKIGSDVEFNVHFYDEEFKTIFNLKTVIGCFDSENNKKQFKIIDETLYSKKPSSIRSKEKLFQYSEENICEKRNNEDKYLLEDVSIIVSYNKEKQKTIQFLDSLAWTNMNALRMYGYFPAEIVKFLDPSIEYLKCDNSGKNITDDEFDLKLKFYNKEEIKLNSLVEINKYLSSGTIKGINLFILAMITLKNGTYMLVDELENHFNMEIVSTLIRFFNDEQINKLGATLIFSTHYIELIDQFERNDCINIVRNLNGIKLDNLSDLIKRNYKSKSDWFKSGYLEHTTPSYDSYISLKREMKSFVTITKVEKNES